LQYSPVEKHHLAGEKMKRFILERSSDEFYTSYSGLALVGLGVNRFTSLNRPSPTPRALPVLTSFAVIRDCPVLAKAITKPLPI
jgi:hypothetical protein